MVSLPLHTELVHPGRSGLALFDHKHPNDGIENLLLRAAIFVFSSGVWPLLSNLDDPELRWLAKAMPATVLECKVDSTTKKYLGAFHRWKT